MKKQAKKFLASLIALTVCFSQTGITAMATNNTGNSVSSPEVEIISVEESTEMLTTAEISEEVTEVVDTTEVFTEEITEDEIEETTESETSSIEDITEEVEEESEDTTETVEETTEENGTEEITEDSTEEVVTDFAGLPEDYSLSEEQVEEKALLKTYQSEINGYSPGEDYVEGEIIVTASTKEDAELFAEAYNGTLTSYYEKRGLALIQLGSGITVEEAVNASVDDVMTYAEDDGTVKRIALPAAWPNYLSYTSEGEPLNVNGISGYNDTGLSSQWHIEYLGAEYAWAEGFTGSGITVAIIDSGILETHEDLRANVLSGHSYVGQVEVEDSTDVSGHGTHVAGIVAADGNNGKGVSGVAPDAKIRSYRVFAEGKGANRLDTIKAIDSAVEDGCQVINMSLGGPGYTPAYHEAIQEAYKAGVAVFVAAGNENNNSKDVYPANFKESITIGALNLSGGAATFSNFGSHVDLAFPGVNIYSTLYTSTSAYGNKNGTSMACPAAAGTAAVILSANPKALQGKSGKAKVDALVKLMQSSAIKSSSSGMGKGTTYLPKALGISADTGKPVAPKFSLPKGTYYQNSVTVSITAETGKTIYYSTNGKNPTFKNGVISNGTEYTGPITLTGAKNITLKAIAVNVNGKASSATTVKYTLQPNPTAVTITSKDKTSKILQGKSVTLQASVTPSYAISNKVEWSVSPAEQGVTVKNGKVSATKNAMADTYTVTAKAIDKKGNVYTNATMGEFTVIVAESAKVNALKATEKTVEVTLGASAKTINLNQYLQATDKSGNAVALSASDIIWKSANTKVVTDACTVVGPGSAKMTALMADGSGKKVTITVKVTQQVTGITVSEANGALKLAKGKNLTLKATVAPANASNCKVEWTISPKDQGVTVSNGKVTAKANAIADTYTVTAKAKDGTGIVSNAYTISVVEGAITKITVPKAATIFSVAGNYKAPKTYQIVPTIEGTTGYDKLLIKYTSSAPGIATVSATGLVTAKAPGKTTITVAATDGSKKSAKITINVNVPMSRLSIAPKGGATEYVAKGKTVEYGVQMYEAYGDPTNKKVIWTVDDTSIAKVDKKSGKVTGVEIGSTTLYAHAEDGSGVIASYPITVVAAPTYFYLFDVSASDAPYYELLFLTNAGVIDEKECYKIEISGNGCYVKDSEMWTDCIRVRATKKGTYKIKVTLLDGSKKSASYTVRFI